MLLHGLLRERIRSIKFCCVIIVPARYNALCAPPRIVQSLNKSFIDQACSVKMQCNCILAWFCCFVCLLLFCLLFVYQFVFMDLYSVSVHKPVKQNLANVQSQHIVTIVCAL